jgi:carbon-monoxide dehydrogenase medium subunit
MATLNMRLSSPRVLIDINRIDGLAGIDSGGATLRIGALARHAEVARSDEVTRHAPLIAKAMPHIAHVAIRNRGTFGGSLAFADPAAELPAVCRALRARFVLESRGGSRTVEANDFYYGLFETARQPGEVLVAAEIPVIADGEKAAFMELARRHGDYAIVGLAAQGRVSGGTFSDMRLAFFGAGDRPILAEAANAVLEGRTCSDDTIAAAQAALDDDLDPMPDLNGTEATKMHLARVLTGRVLKELAA